MQDTPQDRRLYIREGEREAGLPAVPRAHDLDTLPVRVPWPLQGVGHTRISARPQSERRRGRLQHAGISAPLRPGAAPPGHRRTGRAAPQRAPLRAASCYCRRREGSALRRERGARGRPRARGAPRARGPRPRVPQGRLAAMTLRRAQMPRSAPTRSSPAAAPGGAGPPSLSSLLSSVRESEFASNVEIFSSRRFFSRGRGRDLS